MKKIISIFLCLLITLTALQIPAFAEFGEVKEEVYDQMNQTFTPVDISSVVNMDFADEIAGDGKGGWTDQGSVNDMRYFDKFGNVKFCGVEFNIIDPAKNKGKAVITLRGQNLETLPNKVEVPIGQKAAGAYILHSAAHVVDDIATYSFVYEDGTRYDVPIRNKNEIFNFWGTGVAERCKTAWNGINESTTSVSLYMYAMENPYPEKVISKMEFATKGSDAFCMIAGITLTDKGPYMLQESDRGNPDTSDWYPYEMPTFDTIVDTVLDFSWLQDGPAGNHGWLQSKDGELVFEDGTPANFWGTDVGENIFVDHKRIDKIVDRIAAMGFNLVRIHNYMAAHAGIKNIFASGLPKKNLNDMRADQLCYTIAKLKEKGIYVYLDMYTTNSGGEDLNSREKDADKYVTNWADDDHWKIDEDYIRDLLGTYNPYTGCKLGEEKAIAFIDMKNENSLFHASRSTSKLYHEDFLKKYNDWLKEKYGTDAELNKAWTYAEKSGLKEGESLEKGNVEIGYVGEREQYNRPRYEDNMHFIADCMTKFYYHFGAIIRELGYGGLMTQCTVWAMYYPSLMYSLTESDLTDSHVYWSHPSAYDSVMGDETVMGGNKPISMLEDKNYGFMGHLISETVYQMPHTITEWDECDLNPTMCEEYTLMGAMSSLQNWQPLNFAFSTQGDEIAEIKTTDGPRKSAGGVDKYNGDPSSLRAYWAANNNPVKMGCMHAGAVMKLRGDVKRADTGFYRRYSQNDYFNPNAQVLNRDPSLGVIGRSGIAYDKRSYDESYNDDSVLYKAYMSKKLGLPYVSVTGEMRTDLVNATFELNTERSQAVTGRITNKDFETDDMIVNVSNPFANINLTSLTDDPIYSSDHLLLTAAGDQRNTDEVRSNDGLAIIQGGTAPILVEPIKGTVTIKTTDDIKVYTIASTGERKGEALVEKNKNGYSIIRLRADDTCMNYEIVRSPGGKGKANEHIVYKQIEVKPLFEDLGGYEWAEKAITRNCLLGDMTGVSETTFAPEASITRSDFVAAVVNACKLKVSFNSVFADVSENDANYTAIGTAKEFGIVKGDENGNFNPNDTVSRADAMAILAKAIEVGNVQCKDTDSAVLGKYSDSVDLPAYAVDGAAKMLSQDYVAELVNERIEPQKNLTRAETAYIVYGILWR